MELLAKQTTLLFCVFSFSLAFPAHINPESIFIPPAHLLRNNAGDVREADSNELPFDPRVPPEVTDQDANVRLRNRYEVLKLIKNILSDCSERSWIP